MRTEHETDATGLASLASNCAALGIRRRLLLLRFPPSVCRSTRIASRRALSDMVHPLATADRGQLFHLPGGHLAVAWRSNAIDGGRSAMQVIAALREAFATLPDAHDGEILVLDLPDERTRLQNFLDSITVGAAPLAPSPGEKLNRGELMALEAVLAHADLARFARRTQVWHGSGDGFAMAWEYRRLDLAELASNLCPGHDLCAETWLFGRLSRTLERRMLALLADPAELRGAGPFALDVGIATLQDPAFVRFDRSLPRVLRGRVVLRISATDLAIMPEKVTGVLRMAQERGYRTLLAAGTALVAALFPAARAFIQLTELAWPMSALPSGMAPEQVLMTGVNSDEALEFAATHDIRYLVGTAVDHLALQR